MHTLQLDQRCTFTPSAVEENGFIQGAVRALPEMHSDRRGVAQGAMNDQDFLCKTKENASIFREMPVLSRIRSKISHPLLVHESYSTTAPLLHTHTSSTFTT